MKRVFSVLSVLLVGALAAGVFNSSVPQTNSADRVTAAQYGEAVVANYESLPKGVILEGTADFGAINSVTYDKEKGALVLNGADTYKLPCTPKEFQQLLKSLQKDDRLGVTLIDGNAKFWGSIENGGSMGKAMIDSDKLMGGVIYGYAHLLEGRKLPFQPQQAKDRKNPVVAVTRFWRYIFEKKGTSFVCVSDELDVQIFPLNMAGRSGSGGHLPDDDVLKNFTLEATDRENLANLQRHKQDLYKTTSLGETSKVGEAAAVARALRDSKIDLAPLMKTLK